jgi:DNA-binding NarL/FixJ family response regulator
MLAAAITRDDIVQALRLGAKGVVLKEAASKVLFAQTLSLSEDTIKHHLTNIFDKTGVSNRLEVALFATHHGLVH